MFWNGLSVRITLLSGRRSTKSPAKCRVEVTGVGPVFSTRACPLMLE